MLILDKHEDFKQFKHWLENDFRFLPPRSTHRALVLIMLEEENTQQRAPILIMVEEENTQQKDRRIRRNY